MKIKGPIAVTEKSHPFSSMKYARVPLELEKYGFVEEEFFISGNVDTYDYDGNFKKIVEIDKNLAYCTRILVRRPKNPSDCTGICFLDILNASNGYDIEDLWRRSYEHILENKHIYIGITSKPVNVLSLKNFDYDRYEELNFSNDKVVKMPVVYNEKTGSISGTQEGLIWEILYSLSKVLKEDASKILGDIKVNYLYLTGQSQSGLYVNAYANMMHNHFKEKFSKTYFDGYLSLVSGGFTRALYQEDKTEKMMNLKQYDIAKVDIPYIVFNAQGDYELFKPLGGIMIDTGNSDAVDNKRRYYEISAAAHTNSASTVIVQNSEILKTKNPPRLLDTEFDYTLNDLPFDYYINAMLDKLHLWASENKAPQIIKKIRRNENDELITDEYGHGLDGLRSPFVEYPIAKYYPNHYPDMVNGYMEMFSNEKILELYGSFENYLNKFTDYINLQVNEGLLTKSDSVKCINWAKEKIRGDK